MLAQFRMFGVVVWSLGVRSVRGRYLQKYLTYGNENFTGCWYDIIQVCSTKFIIFLSWQQILALFLSQILKHSKFKNLKKGLFLVFLFFEFCSKIISHHYFNSE